MVEYGFDAGAQAVFGFNWGSGLGGDSFAGNVSDIYGGSVSAPTAGDLTLGGILSSPPDTAAFTVGPGAGVSVDYDRTQSVFTLNTLKGMVYRLMFEGRLSDE